MGNKIIIWFKRNPNHYVAIDDTVSEGASQTGEELGASGIVTAYSQKTKSKYFLQHEDESVCLGFCEVSFPYNSVRKVIELGHYNTEWDLTKEWLKEASKKRVAWKKKMKKQKDLAVKP